MEVRAWDTRTRRQSPTSSLMPRSSTLPDRSTSITPVPASPECRWCPTKDAELDLNFQGDDITRVETSLGELVTVTLQTVPDAFTRSFTLIVPTIRVPHGGQAEFDTLGIETTDRSSSFVGPSGTAGVLQTYQVHQLHGNAQQVDF